MGKVAAELLLDRIGSQNKKERTPRQVIIPVELIERESAIPISEVNYE
jgi:DNA-binding LacI/PurR family transcriptional regulator